MKLISGLAVIALAATTLAPTLLAAQPASAVEVAPPTQRATDWSATQLTGGVAIGGFGPEVGLSIDAGFAFDALGRTADADGVGDGIAEHLVTAAEFEYGYVKANEYDWETHALLGEGKYANATAKAAAFTQRISRDPSTAYADVDLVAQLEELTDDSTGVIADVSFYPGENNFANTIGQAFAVEALTVAGSSEATAATTALLSQQCPAGYFRLELSTTACADGSDQPHPDVTALAVLSLTESDSAAPGVTTAITQATEWLESVQKSDGSFEGDVFAPGSNSNSTGLAGWALGTVGKAAAAAKAAAWVRSMQVADAGACASQAPTGAIAYDPAALDAGRTGGIDAARSTWRRSTFQSSPVLQWAPAASTPLAISSPASAVEKSTVTATITGLAPGEQGCVTFGGVATRVVGTGSAVTAAFDLPAGAGARTFTVTTLAGSQSSVTTAVVAPVPTPVPTPVPASPEVGDLVVAKVERVKHNAFQVAVKCQSTVACAGKLVVQTRWKVTVADGERRKVVVARTTYAVEPGQTEKLVLKVRKPARAALGTSRLRVVGVQTAPDAVSAETKFWLRRT